MASRKSAVMEKVTAVVMCDSFTNDYKPVTNKLPRCLTPLLNHEILYYVIESLIRNSIDEIFLLCNSYTDKIEAFVTNQRYPSSVVVKVLSCPKCTSPGQALRELHNFDVIRGDFILVPADLITNYTELIPILQRHKERRQKDSSFLMTIVLKEQRILPPPVTKPSRPPQSPLVRVSSSAFYGSIDCLDGVSDSDFTEYDFSPVDHIHGFTDSSCAMEERVTAVFETEQHQLLNIKQWYTPANYHESWEDNTEDRKDEVLIPREIILAKRKLQIRTDVIETNVYIFSVDMLIWFRENFDQMDLKRDAIKSILMDHDLNNKLGVDIIKPHFMERALSFTHYSLIVQAMLSGWAYPFKAELSVPKSARCDPTAVVERSVIGEGTVIGRESRIFNSTIGPNCRIGDYVLIRNATILGDVIVESSVKVTNAFVSKACQLRTKCELSPGTVLAEGVIIGKSMETEGKLRVYVPADGETDASLVGTDGLGVAWEATGEELKLMDITAPIFHKCNRSVWSELLGDELTARIKHHSHRPGHEAETVDNTEDNFVHEVELTLTKCLDEQETMEHCSLEVHSLKFAFDRTFADTSRALSIAVLRYAENSEAKDFAKRYSTVLDRWKGSAEENPLKKFVNDGDCQRFYLRALVEAVETGHTHLQSKFHLIITKLINSDIITSDIFLDWSRQVKGELGEGGNSNVATLCASKEFKVLVEWLEEEDEDEEEEDD